MRSTMRVKGCGGGHVWRRWATPMRPHWWTGKPTLKVKLLEEAQAFTTAPTCAHYFNIWDLEDQDDDPFGYGGGLDEEDDTAASNGGSEDMRKRPHVVSVGPAHTAASVDQKATAGDKKAEEGVSYYGKDHLFGVEEFDGFEFGGNPRLEESNEGGGPKMTKAAHKRGRERRAEAATCGDGGPSPCDHLGGPESYRGRRKGA